MFSYLPDQIIPQRIYKYYSDVKLVMLLCEPEHRTLSHYLHATWLNEYGDRKDKNGKAPINHMDNYENTMNEGLKIILEDEPELHMALNNTKAKFTRYIELREAVYRFSFSKRFNSVLYLFLDSWTIRRITASSTTLLLSLLHVVRMPIIFSTTSNTSRVKIYLFSTRVI